MGRESVPRKKLSRRNVLRQVAGASLTFAAVGSEPNLTLTPEDDAFLEELERATFRFFLEQSDPDTGLVKDRHNVRAAGKNTVSSIAATGFGLTAFCIGAERSYIPNPKRRAVY